MAKFPTANPKEQGGARFAGRSDQAQVYETAANASDVASLTVSELDRDVSCLAGIPVDLSDIDMAVARIDTAIREKRRLSFVTPNANWLVRAVRDDSVRDELIEADFSVLDGAPLVVMAKLLGIEVKGRVAGSDIFEALRRRPDFGERAIKVFFFGGRDGAAQAAHERLNSERGGVQSVGWLNPGFGDVQSMSADSVINEINASGADFVLVALGAAKGQQWIEANKTRLEAPVISHLGAVVDFTGGGIRRAPAFLQKAGLEWLWRIKEEPTLWKRYFFDSLALLNILVTRIAPMLLARLRQKQANSDSPKPGYVKIDRQKGRTVLDLSNACTAGDVAQVREAMKTAVLHNGDVILEFGKARFCDPGVLGKILILEKLQKRQNRRVFIAGASKPLQRILKANGITLSGYEKALDESEPVIKGLGATAA